MNKSNANTGDIPEKLHQKRELISFLIKVEIEKQHSLIPILILIKNFKNLKNFKCIMNLKSPETLK